ncbi:unnamed protein product [Hydatigera taeniaeformis]|uniref:Nanos-type domain-containing protein n=1 Tax=Hydatigena taeniaeformis TaxID=6205 RepID=A0A0R3WZE5_HYDTA|nr:unnamed protein product [Hydatigera taeniaeformis]
MNNLQRRSHLGLHEMAQLVKFFKQLESVLLLMSTISRRLCVFCRNNNETFEVYSSHKLKDELGRVTCPVLRKLVCPLCNATGDKAHTPRYCKRNTSEFPAKTLANKF